MGMTYGRAETTERIRQVRFIVPVRKKLKDGKKTGSMNRTPTVGKIRKDEIAAPGRNRGGRNRGRFSVPSLIIRYVININVMVEL